MHHKYECGLNCAFVGVGGGGGKLAKAFLDMGFNKTLLINTTPKDQPDGVDPQHLVLIPDADGVAKNVEYGKDVFRQNSTVVEDALRTKLGKVDWIFVLAGGGGGTGGAAAGLGWRCGHIITCEELGPKRHAKDLLERVVVLHIDDLRRRRRHAHLLDCGAGFGGRAGLGGWAGLGR